MIKTKEDIKLLSEVWEIKSKQQEITDKFYCCKIKVEKKDIIIYFNEPGFAISHDSITNAQNLFKLVKIFEETSKKQIQNAVFSYLKSVTKY